MHHLGFAQTHVMKSFAINLLRPFKINNFINKMLGAYIFFIVVIFDS
jgi:hypothetical protein